MVSIPVYRPYLHGQISNYVNECLQTGWISSRGEFIGRFEEAFATYVGAEGATSVANGTVAIHLALEALGLKPGDEVIVPTFTYIASVNTILQTGARPVYVDSLEDTLQVDPEAVRAAITPRTRAVMVVHLYGHPCDMDAISAICDEHGLLLVEDCAEAFGTRWRGRHVGTFGDVATFSFFGNKTITTGEGGMVLARDPEVLARCRHLKSQGVSPVKEYWHDVLAYNYRMTNIEAAIGLSQIELAADILDRKTRLAAAYRERLAGLPLRCHNPIGDVTHSFWMCSVILDDGTVRDSVRQSLKDAGIDTRPFFPPAHRMPHSAAPGNFPIADKLSGAGINLPSFPEMTQAEIDRVCDVLRKCF
ncbi:perosamine synthetase [Aureimonas altamirensis]|uniref:GDP-perosamine synthase n=1 Tax=Aureimonas altamirensis TaxID=370622 RepID=A0A0B1Q011_9HYPH|nr:DegT/DnrJ/EryC1/StrS family aminotransferase [Aureimonas altamirensis]KHJ54113.1 perosamine synthetase [Aureimonas altamirensis]